MCARVFIVLVIAVLAVSGHGIHADIDLPSDAPWAARHMAEEHHIGNFDAASFFTLHDFDSSGQWSPAEVRRFYGLEHQSNRDASDAKREEVTSTILRLMDADGDGLVSRDEWMTFSTAGKELPDFGLGPGHHGDEEYEYEIHHWEKYHNEDSPDEEYIHPEDIEHFRRHDEIEAAQALVDRLIRDGYVEENIPHKFLREL